MGDVEGGGPGVGVRVVQQGERFSPLDKSWQLLDQNEHGKIVDSPLEEEEEKKDCSVKMEDSQTVPTDEDEDGCQKEEDKGHSQTDIDTDVKGSEKEDTDQSSTRRPSQLFEAGTMVEVKGYGFGVVKWVGEMAGQETAGVELESYSSKGGDGTPEGSNHPLFPCIPGHSVFTPVEQLTPDSRFLTFEPSDPLSEVEQETVEGKVNIPKHTVYCNREYSGIQGEHNSCYIDATLFGLFALSSQFDNLLTPRQASKQGNHGNEGSVGDKIRNILLTKIINPLRKNGIVRCEPVLELREELDSLGKIAGLRQDEKDPEEFLNILFKHALSAKPFISIQRPQGVEQEFFVQLFTEPDPTILLHTISDLLNKTFSEQKIEFSQVPEQLLIQVPRYGRQFKMFNRVIPNKKLNISKICQSSCPGAGDNGRGTAPLKLLSVLCIDISHYVCFTYDDSSHWIFSDSMADRIGNSYNIPKCSDCTEVLEEWVYSDRHRQELEEEDGKKLPELVRRFTQDVYMCVYVDDSTPV